MAVTLKVTLLLHWPATRFTMMFPGQLITGGLVSGPIVASTQGENSEVLLLASVAVAVMFDFDRQTLGSSALKFTSPLLSV